MTVVTLTPAHDRPYVDGSQNNSVYEQVFVYDGFGRTSQQPAFQQFLGGIHLNPEILNGPSPAWNRLVQGDLGRDTGWLLPAALAVGVGGLFTRRRSYFILWTGWLVPMVLVFSDVFIMHAYYTAALAPPIAAILGAGVASLWESRTEARSVAMRRCGAAGLIVAGTVGYGIWLTRSSGADAPTWLGPLAASTGCGGRPAPGGLGRRLVPPMAPGRGARRRHGGHPGHSGFRRRPPRERSSRVHEHPVRVEEDDGAVRSPARSCRRRRSPRRSSRSSRGSRWDLPT